MYFCSIHHYNLIKLNRIRVDIDAKGNLQKWLLKQLNNSNNTTISYVLEYGSAKF